MSEPIICFEGPSGVGKTTMCRLLSPGYHVVPEVNELYIRSENESKLWYHEKQIERYDSCKSSNIKSILDGDVFQPIWYNWVCGYPSNFLSKEETLNFYKTKIADGSIRFPDLYIIFHVEEKELWIRKENDETRQRRNFEKHLRIIEPLKSYYRFLDRETDIDMKFIHYSSIEETKNKIQALLDDLYQKDIDQLKAYEQIENWINRH